jgi:hypothetical protein
VARATPRNRSGTAPEGAVRKLASDEDLNITIAPRGWYCGGHHEVAGDALLDRKAPAGFRLAEYPQPIGGSIQHLCMELGGRVHAPLAC